MARRAVFNTLVTYVVFYLTKLVGYGTIAANFILGESHEANV